MASCSAEDCTMTGDLLDLLELVANCRGMERGDEEEEEEDNAESSDSPRSQVHCSPPGSRTGSSFIFSFLVAKRNSSNSRSQSVSCYISVERINISNHIFMVGNIFSTVIV